MERRALMTLPTIDPQRPTKLVGYAARFNEPSRVITERGKTFREVMLPGAFKRSLAAPPRGDIVALWNHGLDNRPPLGRTGSGTLRLWEDAEGLRYEIDLPEWAGDVKEAVKRGDVAGSSVAFNNEKALWKLNGPEQWRYVQDLDLHEISPVITPAYPTTSAGLRFASAAEVPDLYPLDLAAARLAIAAAESAGRRG